MRRQNVGACDISRCNTVEKDSPCGKVSKPTDNYSCDDIEVDKSEDLSLLVDDKDEEYLKCEVDGASILLSSLLCERILLSSHLWR
jgi:hypothetical protein